MNELEQRRTFAIISHPDAGKTTITEKVLLYGQAIQKLDEPSGPLAVGMGGHKEGPGKFPFSGDGRKMVFEVVLQYFLSIFLQGTQICQRTDKLMMNRFAIR